MELLGVTYSNFISSVIEIKDLSYLSWAFCGVQAQWCAELPIEGVMQGVRAPRLRSIEVSPWSATGENDLLAFQYFLHLFTSKMTNDARTWSCPSWDRWKNHFVEFFSTYFRLERFDAKAFTFAWVKAVVAHGGSTSQMKSSIEAGTKWRSFSWPTTDVKRILVKKLYDFCTKNWCLGKEVRGARLGKTIWHFWLQDYFGKTCHCLE